MLLSVYSTITQHEAYGFLLVFIVSTICLYSAWASRCRFITQGNARASIRGTTIVNFHAFLCMYVPLKQRNNKYKPTTDAIIETSSNTLVAGCKTTIIPYGVVNIRDYAFYYCEELNSISIPNSVTSIGS